MKKESSKYFLMNVILFYFPVVVTLIVSLMHFTNGKVTDGIGFLFVSLFIGAGSSYLLFSIRKYDKRVKSIEKSDQFLELPITGICGDEESGLFDFITEVEVDGVLLCLNTMYLLPSLTEEQIKERMREKDIQTMKVWITLPDYKHFSYDLKGFLEKLDLLSFEGKEIKIEKCGTQYFEKEN